LKHLLIDTNCWVDLLRNAADEDNLNVLAYWIENSKAVLLIPETMAQEWNKQKKVQLDDLKKQNEKTFDNIDADTKEILKSDFKRIQQKAALMQAPVKLTTLRQFKLTSGGRCKLTTSGRSKLTTG
jgi:predicted nucleic acid-binding protein